MGYEPTLVGCIQSVKESKRLKGLVRVLFHLQEGEEQTLEAEQGFKLVILSKKSVQKRENFVLYKMKDSQ